ncbi:hypothetical protein HanHA300_Chr13g0470011 [Helianthus annuus]|nr:hypothetical protein HanHA300_Chr13g0470011 [Helianthus annuus]KAJ0496618.1 hypothetical protein HanHA89_Chr13g0501881 [Helianthus annuus]KAJ0662660.1 hypothetical protein HanLR1_Chr13g0472221 [Helianthus annuus]
MEDSSEESIVDVDVCDVGNQLAVVEYVKDLYAYYRSMESCSLGFTRVYEPTI